MPLEEPQATDTTADDFYNFDLSQMPKVINSTDIPKLTGLIERGNQLVARLRSGEKLDPEAMMRVVRALRTSLEASFSTSDSPESVFALERKLDDLVQVLVGGN